MFVIKYRKIWYAFSAILFALSFYGIYQYGFNQSIDFKGGTITEVRYDNERPAKDTLEAEIAKLSLGGFSLRPSGEDRYVIRTKELSPTERQSLNAVLSPSNTTFEIVRSNTIGPIAGSELKSKAMKAIVVVVL